MQRNRGKNLPGMLSTTTVQAVFRQQSVPWARIAANFGESCYEATEDFLREAIMHVAGRHTGEALMRECVYSNKGFYGNRRALEDKIHELLWPFTKSHPMTYNPKYSTRVAAKPESPSASATGAQRWGDIAIDTPGFTDDMISAADALDQTEAYYDVSAVGSPRW